MNLEFSSILSNETHWKVQDELGRERVEECDQLSFRFLRERLKDDRRGDRRDGHLNCGEGGGGMNEIDEMLNGGDGRWMSAGQAKS
jgi:hypothetical protein